MSQPWHASSQLYIGLMSGTSVDGVDVALVDFQDYQCQLVASFLHPITEELRQVIYDIATPKTFDQADPPQNRIERLAHLDAILGQLFADSVNSALTHWKLQAKQICAIGSHGQTIRHRGDYSPAYTLQIGDPNIIAERTGIKTIADFRRMDIAAGGQGAPLAPAFHNAVLRSNQQTRVILNLGGLANITLLPSNPNSPVIGFDTGPANGLLDAWYQLHHPNASDSFDRDAAFAQKGQVLPALLECLLSDPYFKLAPPKSSGKEYFNVDWLEKRLTELSTTYASSTTFEPADVQRTLLQLTVESVADAIKLSCEDLPAYNSILVLCCGGGAHNRLLRTLLSEALNQRQAQYSVDTTDTIGISGDYLEAMTFAWLAKQRVELRPGNLPSVTGAKQAKVLGAEYLP